MDNKLPKTKIDERTGIEYHLEGDYYIPNLAMPKQEKITLNKYGKSRLKYLKEDKKADYTIMLVDGTLNTHLKEIQESRCCVQIRKHCRRISSARAVFYSYAQYLLGWIVYAFAAIASV